jgi:hypothetical protein
MISKSDQIYFSFMTALFILLSACAEIKTSTVNTASESKSALGSFHRSLDKVIFKPILCMNMERCEDVDFSNFPKPSMIKPLNPIWENKNNAFADSREGVLWVLYTKEKNFNDAVFSQVSYEKK